ncbi:recombination-associated protein RdgC [Candidatus Sodalis sp. SoCistrobi]|uniref:recombination-associated protein RdgC n=1 Tax=Candidatus Sodalis sp. SoCistrobi TaxID=1922216 RepID=UPI00093C8362|nr:recombination-associated protein RdgC [Candidatus Sodalis sp. SoCistrobi]
MLWFKNVMIYRLNRPIELSVEQIEQQLSAFAFTPCGSQDMAKSGWVPPMGAKSDALTHAIPGHVLLCLRKEEKILPSSVVKQELEGKISKLENDQSRKLRKTEKDALKDEVLHQLMPRAFSRFGQTLLWLDLANDLVLVDAGSAKKAEDCLALLRKSIGSLPVVPLTMEKPIEMTLTEWVRSGEPAAGFAIQDEAELKALLEEGGILRCKKQDLSSDEIAVHIEAGKLVTKLALDWRERVQLILGDDGTVKRLRFSDTLREQNDDIDRDDFAARFDADFMLMTGELTGLIAELIAGLGGEAPRQG